MIDFQLPPQPRDILTSPFLRWVGSKSRMASLLRVALPSGRRLLEPFTGSAAVFLGTRYPAYVLGDRNEDLINLYTWLQRDVSRFLRFAKQLFLGSYPDEETYERTRNMFNKAPHGSLERAVLFLWMNKTCFNGICRYNAAGEFNVPKGDRTGPLALPEEQIILFHRKSQIAVIKHADFRRVIEDAKEGDVVYCDPPYVPRSATASFTKYTKDDFSLDDHNDLAEACRNAASRGATVVVSNSDTPVSCDIYHDALLVKGRLVHLVGGQGQSRTSVGEALFLFGDPRESEFWSMARLARPEKTQIPQETCYTP